MVELHEFLIPELNRLAKVEGFEEGAFQFTTSLASNVGDGFMGLLLRVIITGPREINGGSVKNDSLALIVKMPPDSQERREQFKSIPIFEREALFYEKIFPLFVEFQRERGITEETDGFFAAPRCYKIIADAEHQNYAMILEDLKITGYQLFDKHKVIDYDHVTLLVQKLARMHALSFAIRDQEPELFAEMHSLKDVMIEHMIDTTSQFEKMMQMGVDRAIKTLDPVADEEKIEKLTKLRNEIIKTLEFCASHEEAEPFGVLLHGDCWNNNMMYAYDEVSFFLFDFSKVGHQR
jgi:Ecdysteroid kinase-like family